MDKAMLDQAHEVLNDYYGVALSDTFVAEVLESDEELLEEAQAGALSDTYVRELLIDCVTRKLGCPVWPSYIDSEEYSKKFKTEFALKVIEAGGKVLWIQMI